MSTGQNLFFLSTPHMFHSLLVRLLLFSFCVSLLLGCQIDSKESEYSDQSKLTIIKGVLENGYNDQKVFLLEAKEISGYRLIDSSDVKSKKFIFSIHDLKEGYYVIQSPNSSSQLANLYLIPNDTLNIIFNNEGTVFEGLTSHIQEYLIKAWEFISEDSLFNTTYQPRYELPTLDIDEAVTVIESIRKKRIDFFNEYFSDKLIFDKFKAIEMAKIELEVAHKYYWYLRYHKYKTSNGINFEYLEVDSSYYQFLDRIDLNSEHYCETFQYLMFLQVHLDDCFIRNFNFFDYFTERGWSQKQFKFDLNYKSKWINEHLEGLNKDYGFYSLLRSSSVNNAFSNSTDLFYDNLHAIYSNLQDNYVDSLIFEQSKTICDGYFNIEPGAKAPPLELSNRDGEIISLEDFSGKIVYIDFWGTWCGPCVASIPQHNQLQNKFSNKDVVFLNIALEQDEEAIDMWKNFLEEHEFQGIHVVAEKSFHNDQIKEYMINSAPSYVLIDKKGKIAKSRAPKPKDASQEISDLLKQSDL